MLKRQDCVILIKIVSHREKQDWSQRELSSSLCISLSEVNAGLKRLEKAGLLHLGLPNQAIMPVRAAALEFLLHSVKYCFPAQLGALTRGVPTGIGAPVFEGQVVQGEDPIPVWPYGKGSVRGMALEPLYQSVPEALAVSPDEAFYEILALVDVLRHGRARERMAAEKLLHDRILGIE